MQFGALVAQDKTPVDYLSFAVVESEVSDTANEPCAVSGLEHQVTGFWVVFAQLYAELGLDVVLIVL